MRAASLTRLFGRAAGSTMLLLAALPLFYGAAAAGRDGAEVAAIDRAIRAATRFLVSRQAADGSWRSETYGGLRDGAALTPPIVKFLFFAPRSNEEALSAHRRGVEYLMSFVGRDGIDAERARSLVYPVYTSAAAAVVIDLESRDERHTLASAAWLRLLRAHQMGPHNGWSREDLVFGGWGYSPHIPRKPAVGEHPYEANLSSTVFGLGALRHAGVPQGDPVYGEVLTFIQRCQNFPDDPRREDPIFDDGGFFFTPADPARNKAGSAGKDFQGRERFRSYGSATADGLRALLRSGLPPAHPRVAAARKWLESNFSATHNPGGFPEERGVLRDAMYYYYCWSAAHTFMALRELNPPSNGGGIAARAGNLARELVRRQAADGSWVNVFSDGKEDDPLVATPLAASSLAILRGLVEDGIRP